MKKIMLFVFSAALLVSSAKAGGFGAGVYGGLNIPVLQNDEGSGKVFGVKLRLKALSFLTLEPNLNFAKYGAPEPDDFSTDIDGAKVTSYGVDGVLGSATPGAGFRPYFVGGIGFYSVSQPDEIADFVDNETNFGFSGGLGFEIGFTPKLGLDIRGKAHIVPLDGGGADKSLTATAGLNFAF